ncbi:serine/threonine-protein phosphatase [Actinomadura sp. WAC 06369]|nr:serine/threonine-protein phosphatase [Actinomadura sp. WAC 06369]
MGLVRKRNEDAFYLGTSLFAVADGLGGHVAGDIASNLAIDALKRHDHPVRPADLPTLLGRGVSDANEELRRKIHIDPGLAGMGTTLVAMLWSQTTAAVANVGDSRVYLLRGTEYQQITEDHTYGHLVAEAASDPRLSERITRFIDGRADGRSPDINLHALRPGDRFVLCSDGLSGVVPHEIVRETLISVRSSDEAADRLVDLAIEHGGPDNVTVLIVDVRAAD